MPYITVFTPVYNRAHTLDRLYDSLLRQSFKDFEWVVVDDGSTDESVKKIKNYINKNELNIKFIQNSHGGKHRAVNSGLKVADGKLFFMLDSDDWLTDDALEKVIKWEKRIPKDTKCSGLCGCMIDPDGKLISKGLKEEYIYMPLTQMIKRGVDGDHADILFTEVFKKYPYPEIEGEIHIAPGVPFIRMANDGYNLLFFNEVVYIAEYGPDGLTAMGDKKSIDNFQGYTLRTRELLHSDVGLKRKIKALVKYCSLANSMSFETKDISSMLTESKLLTELGKAISSVYDMLQGSRRG